MSEAISFSSSHVKAQITPDSTLGAESSVVTPQATNSSVDVIQGGATRGANLFHSFEQFSVPIGSAAHFNNALDIQNIISRVTGGSVSTIYGLIQANGTANLFLLNPNGIIFGPNASLNIGGSFLGSTASSLNFADGTQFSATKPQATPLLTMSVPIGLQYGGTNSGSILNQTRVTNSSGETVGLQVQPSKTLALVGGDVNLDGGKLTAPGGRIELGGVAGAGTLGLNVDSNNLSLSYPEQVQRASVSLTNGAEADVTAGGGGSLAVTAWNLELMGGSTLLAGIRQDSGSVGSQAGNVEINATGTVTASRSNIFNIVQSRAMGNAGNINVTTGSLFLNNNSQLGSGTRAKGDAGNITIQARDTVSFDGASDALSTVESGEGKGANINITTGSLFLNNDSQLGSGTRAKGDAGNITIQARDTVSFDGASDALSIVGLEGEGNAGDINITTGSLSLTNGSQLGSNTRAKGDAGNITIQARDTVSFNGVSSFNGSSSGVVSTVAFGGEGKGGDINVTTGSLSLTNGSLLGSGTLAKGDAGNITIQARDTVSLNGKSYAVSIVGLEGEGKGGNINVTTGSLSLTNGAALSAGTTAKGDAGNITIQARDTVSLDRESAVLSNVGSGGEGKGGNINVTTRLLDVRNGSGLSATSIESDVAGSVSVKANSIHLDNQAFLSSDTKAGQGNITLHSQDLVLRHNSNITTNATGPATGGNITIDTGVIAALENSDIRANAEEGSGGRVIINAQSIFGTEFRNQPTSASDITANSNLGPQFSGTVEINTSNVDLNQGLITLPVELVNVEGLIANSCIARSGEQRGSFNIAGAGGLPTRPGDASISPYPTGTVRSIPNNDASSSSSQRSSVPSTNEARRWKMGDPIVEPQGVYRLANGELVMSRECSH